MFGSDAVDERPARPRPRAPEIGNGRSRRLDDGLSPLRTIPLSRFMAGEPMKPATNRFAGRSNSSSGAPICSMLPRLHHDDLVGHGHRLDLVVRDVDRRRLQSLVQFLDLGAHLHAQLGVEVGQRLVEQEHLRIAHNRAAHRDALALSARKLARIAVEVGIEVEDVGGLLDALAR